MRRKKVSEIKDSTSITPVNQKRNCTENYGTINDRLTSYMSVQPELNPYQDKSMGFNADEKSFFRQCTNDARYRRRSGCGTNMSAGYQSSTSEIDSYMSTLDIITQVRKLFYQTKQLLC